MKTIRSFIIATFGLCFSVALNIVVMIKGWGLEPKSWFWIIPAYLIGGLFAQLLIMIAKEDE